MHSAIRAEHQRAALLGYRLDLRRGHISDRFRIILVFLVGHIRNGSSALNAKLIPSYQALTAIYAKHNLYPFADLTLYPQNLCREFKCP